MNEPTNEKNKVIESDTPCQYPKTLWSRVAVLTWRDDFQQKKYRVSSNENHVQACAVGKKSFTAL